MAVNLLRINLLRCYYSPIVYPLSFWNVYSQIFRRNCENKDDKFENLEIFLNKLQKKKTKSFKDNIAHDDEILQLITHHNEDKLLNLIIKSETLPASKWIDFRNDCLVYMCSNHSSKLFSNEFIKLLNKVDHNYAKNNEKLLSFLTTFRERLTKNLDSLIADLCELHLMYTSSNSISKHHIRLVTETILDEVFKRHGTGVQVKITKSFKEVCNMTDDYELLFVLWQKLFESFWFSDQVAASQLIEEHVEIRNILSSRGKQLCFQYFQDYNTDQVNKLLQIFLNHKMKMNAAQTIKLYLAFECWRQNSSAATEVVSLCIKLNISLTESENKKYLNLLLKRRPQTQKEQKTKQINVQKYKFQF